MVALLRLFPLFLYLRMLQPDAGAQDLDDTTDDYYYPEGAYYYMQAADDEHE